MALGKRRQTTEEQETNKLKMFIPILIAIFWLTGCGSKGSDREKEIRTSPQSQEQTGTLMQSPLSTDEVHQQLKNEPKAKIRTLDTKGEAAVSENIHIYEIHNVPQEKLSRIFSNAKFEDNKFLPNLSQLTTPFAKHEKYLKAHSIRNVDFSKLKSQLDRPTDMQGNIDISTCIESKLSYQPIITQMSQGNPGTRLIRHNYKMVYGASISLNARLSYSRANEVQSPVKVNWLVARPHVNDKITLLGTSLSLVFEPKSFGHHKLGLLLMDDSGVCSYSYINFMASYNPPYQTTKSPESVVSRDFLEKFSHIAKIRANRAWEKSQGQDVVIALIDHGINYNNPLLSRQILTYPTNKGPSEEKFSKIGPDFTDQDSKAFDEDGRGSKVAGIFAGSIFGIARLAKILPIRAMNSLGTDEGTLAAAIRFAVNHKAQIIYLPFGSFSQPGKILRKAVDFAEQKNVLLVTSAGRAHPLLKQVVNIDNFPYFPASLPNNNILVVAATRPSGKLATYSNYGPRTVDIGAPGGAPNDPLLSTGTLQPDGELLAPSWGGATATALVCGVAALIKALDPELPVKHLKEILINSGDVLSTKSRMGRNPPNLNAIAAINYWEKNYKLK